MLAEGWHAIIVNLGNQCAELGSPLLFWDHPMRDQVLQGLKAEAQKSFAMLVPDTEPPWWAPHAVTGGTTAAVFIAYGAAKRKAESGVIDVGDDDQGADVEEENEQRKPEARSAKQRPGMTAMVVAKSPLQEI